MRDACRSPAVGDCPWTAVALLDSLLLSSIFTERQSSSLKELNCAAPQALCRILRRKTLPFNWAKVSLESLCYHCLIASMLCDVRVGQFICRRGPLGSFYGPDIATFLSMGLSFILEP